jgi:NDP-sugar pyrophosphorylase family protein
MNKPRIFISHSSYDNKAVTKLAKDLDKCGVEVWLDEWQISTGDEIVTKVQKGLAQADYIAVWLTKKAVKSGWVEREWQSQLSKEIKENRVIVLPLLAEDCDIPELLRNKRYADFRTNYKAGLNDLIKTATGRRTLSKSEHIRIIILAGGLATRLWPLTSDCPKALIKLTGKTVLQHQVELASDVDNVKEIIICIDKNKASQFSAIEKKLIKTSKVKISFMKHSLVGKNIKGPITKLKELTDLHRLDDCNYNLVLGVDNIFTFALSDIVSFAINRAVSCNAVIEKHVAPRGFGVAKTEGDILTEVMEKPDKKMEAITKISTACYVYTKTDIKKTKIYLEKKYGDDNLGSFIAWLCLYSDINACSFDSEWCDIGTREGLLTANRLIISKECSERYPDIIPGKNCVIKSPVYIENGVKISNSEIGPNVYLGKNCDIKDSNISDSIIYEDSCIKNCHNLSHVIVGQNSFIEGNVGEGVYGANTRIMTLEK